MELRPCRARAAVRDPEEEPDPVLPMGAGTALVPMRRTGVHFLSHIETSVTQNSTSQEKKLRWNCWKNSKMFTAVILS